MADGFRILESGDYRITEATDFRITEQFIETFANLAGALTVSNTAVRKQYGSLSINGVGSFSPVVTFKAKGVVSVTGALTTSNTAIRRQYGLASVNGAGTIVVVPKYGKFGASSLNGILTTNVQPKLKLKGLADLIVDEMHVFTGVGILEGQTYRNAAGTVSATPRAVAYRQSNLSSTLTVSITPKYTGRVTSNLNALGTISSTSRVVKKVFANLNAAGTTIFNPKIVGYSNLSATLSTSISGTRTPFTSTMYVKDAGWKTINPYVKHLGTWKAPSMIYKKVSGAWRRVY